MTKKKFSVVGNCQAPFVAQALLSNPVFAAHFEYQHTPAVHVIPKVEIETYLSQLDAVDLVIHQPILSADRFGGLETTALRQRLGHKAQLFCFPSCYFNGYFPTIGMVSNQFTPAGGVHDLAVFHAFDLGWDIARTERVLFQQDAFGAVFYQRAFERSLKELQDRETTAKVDIRVSDILGEAGRRKVLMHQFNHPIRGLFNALAARICLRLGIDDAICVFREELDTVVWPVWPWVHEALGLQSGGSAHLMVRKEQVAMADFIAGSFATYEAMAPQQIQACASRLPRVRQKMEAL